MPITVSEPDMIVGITRADWNTYVGTMDALALRLGCEHSEIYGKVLELISALDAAGVANNDD